MPQSVNMELPDLNDYNSSEYKDKVGQLNDSQHFEYNIDFTDSLLESEE